MLRFVRLAPPSDLASRGQQHGLGAFRGTGPHFRARLARWASAKLSLYRTCSGSIGCCHPSIRRTAHLALAMGEDVHSW